VTTFEVLGTTETPLPKTGSNVFGLVILASGLILAGASLMGMTRRRT
jgi:LPXTG-motif cell wall-anchored protein